MVKAESASSNVFVGSMPGDRPDSKQAAMELLKSAQGKHFSNQLFPYPNEIFQVGDQYTPTFTTSSAPAGFVYSGDRITSLLANVKPQ